MKNILPFVALRNFGKLLFLLVCQTKRYKLSEDSLSDEYPCLSRHFSGAFFPSHVLSSDLTHSGYASPFVAPQFHPHHLKDLFSNLDCYFQ